MVAQVLRWAGMIGAVVCGYVLTRLEGADWIGGPAVTWGEPAAMLLYTDQLPADAGQLVRFFMVAALPWGAVVAATAVTVGLRGPSSRWYAALLPLIAGAVLAGAASDNVGGRERNIDDARDVAVLHQTPTVAAAVYGYLAIAAVFLLFRLHTVYSAMLALLYAAVAAYSLAGSSALSGALEAGGQVHPTGAPRTFALVCVAAAGCATVATVGTAMLPRLPRRRPVLVVRAAKGTWRAVHDVGQSIAAGLTPGRPEFRLLLVGGLIGVLMCGGALVLGFGTDQPAVDVPSPARSAR
ncbi:hypothetical protein ACQP00_25165 [Dactylosporangium sp. CS-047395]|uniref:hypothetical protein n=1 Tax=Dactylosporangium sp. CS-047395 TaxID=3239936 RepID=UPI003D93298A